VDEAERAAVSAEAKVWLQAISPQAIAKTSRHASRIPNRIAAGFVLKIIFLPKNAGNNPRCFKVSHLTVEYGAPLKRCSLEHRGFKRCYLYYRGITVGAAAQRQSDGS